MEGVIGLRHTLRNELPRGILTTRVLFNQNSG